MLNYNHIDRFWYNVEPLKSSLLASLDHSASYAKLELWLMNSIFRQNLASIAPFMCHDSAHVSVQYLLPLPCRYQKLTLNNDLLWYPNNYWILAPSGCMGKKRKKFSSSGRHPHLEARHGRIGTPLLVHTPLF